LNGFDFCDFTQVIAEKLKWDFVHIVDS
jgi:hypothetical protein